MHGQPLQRALQNCDREVPLAHEYTATAAFLRLVKRGTVQHTSIHSLAIPNTT